MPGLGTCEAGACETFQDCDWMPIGRKRRKRAKEYRDLGIGEPSRAERAYYDTILITSR